LRATVDPAATVVPAATVDPATTVDHEPGGELEHVGGGDHVGIHEDAEAVGGRHNVFDTRQFQVPNGSGEALGLLAA
jgi:hypothetical protein